MNWLTQYRLQRARQDFGENVYVAYKGQPAKLRLLNFWFHPYMEIWSLVLIFTSLGLLFWDMSIEQIDQNWAQHPKTHLMISYADFTITLFFLIEIICKVLLAPNKVLFLRKNFIDVIAVLPLFRVFRLARTARLLRIIRLLKTIRLGKVFRSELVKEKSSFLFRNETTAILTYLGLSVIFGTVGIMYFEKGSNENFAHVGDGIWWCIVTITTVGYGDMFPITLGGKIVAVTIMFVGLSFYAVLTGTISTFLIERAQQMGDRLMDIDILDEHIIICGWNDDIWDVITTLLASTDRSILIISERIEQQFNNPRVFLLTGNPSNRSVLEQGHIKRAFSSVILSERSGEQSNQDVDAKSILIALAINICNPNTHITIELQNPDNIEHAKNAGANDFITPTAYQGSLLAQSAASPGVSEIFSQIFVEPEHFIQRIDISPDWVGETYLSLVQIFTREQRGTLLGIQREHQSLLSPDPTISIQATDTLLILTSSSTNSEYE